MDAHEKPLHELLQDRLLHFDHGCHLLVDYLGLAGDLEAKQPGMAGLSTGFLTSKDGVRLYYAKVGNGPKTVIVSGRLFTFRDFQRLM